MRRAIGANAIVLHAFETAYGVKPVGEWRRTPFVSSTLGGAQGLIEDDTIAGRDGLDPAQDVIDVDGDLVVPVDQRNFGLWLKGLFGAPATTGAAPNFSHAFASGADILPSAGIEIGLPDLASGTFFANLGCVVNSIALTFARSGINNATVSLIGQKEERAAVPADATPQEFALARFSQFRGSVTRGGASLANVTAGSLNLSNNLERVPAIRSDGLAEGVDPGRFTASGQLTLRLADLALLDAAANGQPVDLALGWVIDANRSLIVALPRVHLPKPKIAINGPGGVEAQFDFQAGRASTATPKLTATLKNDVAVY